MNLVSRKKSSWGDDDDDDDDIISHLPGEILCHILSFIPTINSVATSVLSKRWKHLWEYVPKLTFDDSRFRSCHYQHARFDITKWLTNSITRNIQSLDLNITNHSRPRFQLPTCIFTCKTLESLMLEGNILFIVPSQVSLPKLRTLKLARLEYLEDPVTLISLSPSLESLLIQQFGYGRGSFFIDSNHQMLSSTLRHIKLVNIYVPDSKYIRLPTNVFTFRTLEKLILHGAFLISHLPTTICMSSLTLLELVNVKYQDDQIFSTLISSCTSLESLNVDDKIMKLSSCTLKVIELKLFGRSSTGHKLVTNAPTLKYLKLNVNGGLIYYQIIDLASSEQAVVIIHFDRGISHDYCSSSLMNIYKALQHVKSLKAEHSFSKGCGFEHPLPMFTRLKELDINIHSYKCGVLLEFINNSTKLEKLTLNGLCGVSWVDPDIVPPCLLTSLKSVTITDFRGGDGVTRMAKYLIGNARILEKMEVCFDRYSNGKKVCKKITSFCRGSEKCVVSIRQMTSVDYVHREVRY